MDLASRVRIGRIIEYPELWAGQFLIGKRSRSFQPSQPGLSTSIDINDRYSPQAHSGWLRPRVAASDRLYF